MQATLRSDLPTASKEMLAPRWQDMMNGAHYSRSALPEHGLRKVASIDVAEQLGFADFSDAHAAHESSEHPESVEEEPSADEAQRNRLIQMMEQYDEPPPPPQYQLPPTSGLSLAELSIEPSTLDEAVLRPVLRSLDTAETLSRNTADAAENALTRSRRPLPLSPLPPAAARLAASQSAARRQTLKDLMQLASPQLLQTLASSDLARRCLVPMLDAEDAATLETGATLGSIRRQAAAPEPVVAAPEPSVAAAPELSWSSGSAQVRLRFGSAGAQVRLRFGSGSASSGAPPAQNEPARPDQQPHAAAHAATAPVPLDVSGGRPVSPGRETLTVERQVGPAQQRPRRNRQKVKGTPR